MFVTSSASLDHDNHPVLWIARIEPITALFCCHTPLPTKAAERVQNVADKVQAVLLLLGGCEVPSSAVTLAVPSLNVDESMTAPTSRIASLNRFREKRKERCFDKKIRYAIRKDVALSLAHIEHASHICTRWVQQVLLCIRI
ncbi:uncharacterized protein LOC109705758 isoform X2 [Ananas comosus]|uniref:Uncharacterized protein LOC109705758 isoform X2 n=1 Tax=Ananas comosus TaxID=4615 RepID=A0A6P5EL34_ANACO|nr:uncharacterized protein LOC109705758 isoform X2 [Ananas comosus]